MSNTCHTRIHFEYKNPSDAERAAHNLSLVLNKETKRASRRYDGYLVCRALFPNLDLNPDCSSNVSLIETNGKTVAMETEDRDSCKVGFWKGVFDAYFPGAKMTFVSIEPDTWIYDRWDPDETMCKGKCVARGAFLGDEWVAFESRSDFETELDKAGLLEPCEDDKFRIYDETESANEILYERGSDEHIQAGEWRDVPPEKCIFGTYKETYETNPMGTVWADGETVKKLIAGKIDLDSYLGYDKGGK